MFFFNNTDEQTLALVLRYIKNLLGGGGVIDCVLKRPVNYMRVKAG